MWPRGMNLPGQNQCVWCFEEAQEFTQAADRYSLHGIPYTGEAKLLTALRPITLKGLE